MQFVFLKGENMTTDALNILCEKLGVTSEYLVNELARYSITMDWIGIIIGAFLLIITTISCIVFKDKLGRLIDLSDWGIPIIIIIVIIYTSTLIILPCCIVDLIGWYVSPVSCAIKCISSCF